MKNLTFLFCGLLLLPLLSVAQKSHPTLTLANITQLKNEAQIIIPVDKQILPFRDKVMVRFPELGAIYNPAFPETRHPVQVANFHQAKGGYTYLGKSVSTLRSTVFLRNQGTHYGVWNDGKCPSLIEYEVERVGEHLEITGKVYSCFYGS